METILCEIDNYYDYNTLIERCKLSDCIYGEIYPPETYEISLSKISHAIYNLRIENGVLIGDIKFLNTTKGKILKELTDIGIKICYNMRIYNQHNKIFTFDADTNPNLDYNLLLRKYKIKKIMNRINENITTSI